LWHLTTLQAGGTIADMKAEPMLSERHVISEDVFVEMVVWRVRSPIAGNAPGTAR
jgi:hypothetical protein